MRWRRGERKVCAAPAPAARAVTCKAVPKLLRHPLKGARAMLKRAGCTNAVVHKGHAKRGRSHVQQQFPKPGTPMRAGDRVSLHLG